MSNPTMTVFPVELPDVTGLRLYTTEQLELLAIDTFEVLRERGEMEPYLETDDLGCINAASYILSHADDCDLEDIYYLIEDELFAREVF